VDLEQYLLSKSACGADTSCSCGCGNKVDPDTLRMFGQKAATQFVGGQVPMNDSIVQMAKEANLNHEQVKRVVEHANNLAFSQMFKAGFSQNITFPMADTSVVMQNLEAPMQVKQANVNVEIVKGSRYVPGQERASLEGAFGYNAVTKAIEKLASPQVDRAALTRQYLDKVGQIQQAQSDLEILADTFELRLVELDRMVKEASAEGYSSEELGACIDAASPSTLMRGYLGSRYGSRVSMDSITKLGQMGMEVMPNPITDSVAILQRMQEQLFQLQDSITEAQGQVGSMLDTMKQPIHEDAAERLFRQSPQMPAQMGQPPQGMPPMAPPMGAGGPPMQDQGQLETTPGPM